VVEDQPGVTRDRLYSRVELGRRPVLLVDTGGLAGGDEDELWTAVETHARRALEEADALIVMVDGREGPTALDHEIADLVRRSGKPYVLAANKMEPRAADSAPLLDLRLGAPLDISAQQGNGVAELEDALEALLPPPEPEPELPEGAIRVAIVGRPNVGKSSLLNALVGEERAIVSPLPGTTRDAFDTRLTLDDRDFVLIDTAGLRKKARVKESLEYYSNLRAIRAIEGADVVLVILDAQVGVQEQDQRIAGFADEAGRAAVLVGNKWDLVLQRVQADAEQELTPRNRRVLEGDFERVARGRLSFLDYAELVLCSATEGWGVDRLLDTAARAAQEYEKRIGTGELNRALLAAVDRRPPPSRKGRQLRIFYATQAAVRPPTVVLFVNDPELMHWSYQRYLVNQLRQMFGFQGTPLRVFVRARERSRSPGGASSAARRRRKR
jgi:GTP-binding protein